MTTIEERKKTQRTMRVELEINGLCGDQEWLAQYLINEFLKIKNNSPLYTNKMSIDIIEADSE